MKKVYELFGLILQKKNMKFLPAVRRWKNCRIDPGFDMVDFFIKCQLFITI